MEITDRSEFIKEFTKQANVLTPGPEELRKMAERCGIKTERGNYSFSTTVRNRSAPLTVYIGGTQVKQSSLTKRQEEIIRNAPSTIKKLYEYMKTAPFVYVRRTMGQNPLFSPRCALYVSIQRPDSVRLPYMWSKTMFEDEVGKGPIFNIIYIPEWQEADRQILVFPDEGVTYILGTDYLGEAKKGFLRLAMYHAKKQGLLGLHAGSKIIKAKDKKGKLKRYGMILFGLTATGKTTHACHDHELTGEGEGIEVVQDDVIFWREDGSALGSENGPYIKTEGLNKDIQPILYHAVNQKDAVLENVFVDHVGKIVFDDLTLTGNGRAVVTRKDLLGKASKSIDLPPIKELDGLIVAFITRRNTVLPIASKLDPEQAVAAFMLGESTESSGGDPKRAGESVRVVGTNPFMIGDEAEEGNIFYKFVKKNPKTQCYLLNTGGVGEIIEETEDGVKVVKQKVTRVEIPEMAAIIRGIARGTIEWVKEPYFNTMVPKEVEGIDMKRFDLSNFYSPEQIEIYINRLKKERLEYLKGFENLDPKVVDAVRNRG